MSAYVIAEALGGLEEYFRRMPDVADQAARLAINQVAEREGLAMLRQNMRAQIDFPSGYLEAGRLTLKRRAAPGRPEAIISGRDRATSLARFASGQTPATTRKTGVRVQVRKGASKLIKKGFLVKLRNGNMGLAIRLKPGERIANKHDMKGKPFGDNLYLLYGPSVDQVFRSVADDAAPEIAERVSKEFFRQFARLSRG